jgi:phosphatidylserine decarboxylase precursor-related protein
MPSYPLAGLALALLVSIPLAWKWQLGILRATLVTAGCALPSGLAVAGIRHAVPLAAWLSAGLVGGLTIGAAFALLAYRFYRDPERTAPDGDHIVVSPADGEVIYVKTSHAGMLPVSDKRGRRYSLTELTKTRLRSDESVVIGIAMNFADVHVNRAPIDGHVTLRHHVPGRFGSLRNPEMVFENERATTVIERDGIQVAVVQIASRLVRRIVSFVAEGDQVALGHRLGAIRLGSQVDLVLPARADLRITTAVGERVRAGESILCVFQEQPASAAVRHAARTNGQHGAIVIGEHCRGLGLVRSLGRRGIPVWTLQPRGELMAGASRYSRRHFTWPDGDDRQRLDCLFALASRHGLDGWALFPDCDESAALLARHHQELACHFRMTVPPWDVLRWAYDKRLTYRLAADNGIDQPATFLPASRDDLAGLDVSFPAILKPAVKAEPNRFVRDKAWPVDDRHALSARYDEARSFVPDDVIMVQELIPGGGEAQFSFAALCQEGRTIASVTARRTRQYPIDFGHSSSFVETVSEPAVEEPARTVLAAMGYTGLVEVEFKHDARDGRYKLLDINPRVWTWHALCGHAGIDFPYLLWLMIHGEPVPEVSAQSGVRWMRMGTDIPAALSAMLRGRLSPGAYARSWSPPLHFATFAADDLVPGLLAGPQMIYSRWHRLGRRTS